jgi:hypothetical protein
MIRETYLGLAQGVKHITGDQKLRNWCDGRWDRMLVSLPGSPPSPATRLLPAFQTLPVVAGRLTTLCGLYAARYACPSPD